MSHSVLIAAPNQTIGYDLRTRVDELEGFTVVDVADSTVRLVEAVQQRDPEIVLIHDQVGPMPALQATRDDQGRMLGRSGGPRGLVVMLGADPVSAAARRDAVDACLRRHGG